MLWGSEKQLAGCMRSSVDVPDRETRFHQQAQQTRVRRVQAQTSLQRMSCETIPPHGECDDSQAVPVTQSRTEQECCQVAAVKTSPAPQTGLR